jgi:hypothetical protein
MAGSGEGGESRHSSQSIHISNVHGDFVMIGATAATAATVVPFVNAFCAELGRRLGGTMADWISRVHAHRTRTPDRVDLVVDVGTDTVFTTIDLEDGSPHEAKAARAADDVSRQVLERGLMPDADTGTWAPPS